MQLLQFMPNNKASFYKFSHTAFNVSVTCSLGQLMPANYTRWTSTVFNSCFAPSTDSTNSLSTVMT